MQIVFRFNGSSELVVSTQATGVLLERIPTDEVTGNKHPETCRVLQPLSKGEARSIASALMQAASEV